MFFISLLFICKLFIYSCSYFFPPSSQSNYNYNVNIKYEYDLKNEEDSNDSPPGEYSLASFFLLSVLGFTARITGQPPCSTPSDYSQNHASQPVETNFSSASFVPSYSGLEIRSGVFCWARIIAAFYSMFRSPKIEKDCFFNGYTNGDCEVEEEVGVFCRFLDPLHESSSLRTLV